MKPTLERNSLTTGKINVPAPRGSSKYEQSINMKILANKTEIPTF